MREKIQLRILNQKNIEEIGSDIRHIKSIEGMLSASSEKLYTKLWFWPLYLLAPLFYFVLLLTRRRSDKLGADVGLRRNIQAKGIAKKRLSKAKKALESDSSSEFHKSLITALERYLSDKLNLELRGLTVQDATAKLKEKNLSEEKLKEYIHILEACEMAQFTGQKSDKSEWQKLYGETETLINSINKSL